MCDIEKEGLSSYCPDVNDLEHDINWGAEIKQGSGAGCYFVNATLKDNKLLIKGAPWRINGTLVNCTSDDENVCSVTSLPAKKDGGYYIYLSGTPDYVHNGTIPAIGIGPPYCLDQKYKLYCQVPAIAASGTSINTSSVVQCNDPIYNPTSLVWTNAPSNWNNLAANTYNNITVKGKCNNVDTDVATCGSMVVKSCTNYTFNNTGTTITNGCYKVSASKNCSVNSIDDNTECSIVGTDMNLSGKGYLGNLYFSQNSIYEFGCTTTTGGNCCKTNNCW